MPSLMRRKDHGGLIDRSRPLSFSFNGQPCLGYAGDTLASALLANGVDLLGRSPRYNRPRGIMGAGYEDQSAYVKLQDNGASRTVHATQIDLGEAMITESVLDWPPPSLMDRVRGFRSRKTIEPPAHHPLRPGFEVDSAYGHCDVLVVGGGPAGLSAARAAGEAGARVFLADDKVRLGGSLSWCTGTIGDVSSSTWLSETIGALKQLPDVRMMPRATAVGFDDRGRVQIVQAQPDDPEEDGPVTGSRFELFRLTASQIILATGAVERPLLFPDNERPGVMLSSAVLTYTKHYAVAPARGPVVLLTNNDFGHRSACMLHDEGIDVAAVVDVRQEIVSDSVGPLCDRGLNLVGGAVIRKVDGETQVNGVDLMGSGGSPLGSGPSAIDCRLIAVCGGHNPRLDLFRRAGGTITFDEARATMVPGSSGRIDHLAGSMTGSYSLAGAIHSGQAAGLKAAGAAGFDSAEALATDTPADEDDVHLMPFWRTPQGGLGNRAKQWVDPRRDLTTGDVSNADLDDQAPILGPLEDLQLHGPSAPDLTPVIDAADEPEPPSHRLLPAHDWHADQGAAFRVVGGWLTPAFYPDESGNVERAIAAEMQAARKGVGAIDLSALSKVEIRGPDAGRFLEHLCCEPLDPFPVESVHYVRLLDDNGGILEHGVVARLEKDRFVLTTSPASEADVLDWINQQLAAPGERFRAAAVPVSAQWATFAVTGPRARQVLLELDRDIDVSTAAFPFLGLRRGKVCGTRAHIARTSNAGEVAFEIAVSANYGRQLWETILAAGGRYGIVPMGQDALTRLGAEKGRIDTPRLAPRGLTPYDLDLAGTYSPKNADFIGKKALLAASPEHERLQLVALRGDDESGLLPEDGVIVQDGVADGAREGRIAISFSSETMAGPLTLALVLRGKQRIGETVHVASGGQITPARIVRPTIFDPGGRRRHG